MTSAWRPQCTETRASPRKSLSFLWNPDGEVKPVSRGKTGEYRVEGSNPPALNSSSPPDTSPGTLATRAAIFRPGDRPWLNLGLLVATLGTTLGSYLMLFSRGGPGGLREAAMFSGRSPI